jgi:hypothetical protein
MSLISNAFTPDSILARDRTILSSHFSRPASNQRRQAEAVVGLFRSEWKKQLASAIFCLKSSGPVSAVWFARSAQDQYPPATTSQQTR